MIKYLLTALFFVITASDSIAGTIATNSGYDLTLPYSLDFNDTAWAATNTLTLEECGGNGTRVTSGCYEGAACLKVVPPTSACTGGGINGGAVGIGPFRYSGVSRIHVRFLVYFGPTYATNVANGGGSLTNKFTLQDDPTRTGILGLVASDSAGRYIAFGVLDYADRYAFKSATEWAIEYAEFRISAANHSEEWIAVEYWIDQSGGGETGMYLWTADGLQVTINGVTPTATGVSQAGFYMNYFNCYGTADAGNYYLMDQLAVSTSYIGPPAGFLTGSDTTAPTATITSPTSTGTHSGSTTPMTSFSGTASDNIAVTSVTWSCPTCTPTSGTASGTTTWSVASIGLSSGDNTITVTAHDAASNTGTDSHIETYTPPPTSTAVAAGAPMSGCSIN